MFPPSCLVQLGVFYCSNKSGTDRLKAMTYANGWKQKLVYNYKGNIQSEIWSKNGETQIEYRYFYDAAQNLVRMLDIMGGKMYNINIPGWKAPLKAEYYE